MKKIIKPFLLFMVFAFTLSIVAQKAYAQSSSVKAIAKSVFTLTTFTKDGTLLQSSRGFFVGNNGEAVSAWKPFVGADSAVVIDANGNAMNVDAIVGANELYDVCKFKVDGKSTKPKLSSNPLKEGDKVWLVGYAVKSPELVQMAIQKVEKFMDKYSYYILEATAPENAPGCPFVNEKGEIIGLLQPSSSSTDLHAIDVNFMNSMTITSGLSVADPVLRQTNIRTQMPSEEKEALVTLVMSGEQNNKNYPKYVNDFKRLFPKSIDGYAAQARIYVANHQLPLAAQEMETAIKTVQEKDVAHSEYSKLIYQQQLLQPDSTFTAWSLDKALDEATKANEIKQDPAYQHQRAQIIYTKGDYQKAYDMFMGLTKTSLRSSDLFYEAAQSKKQLKASPADILSLLDSAVVSAPRPLTNISAPYILARGVAYNEAGEYKKALEDYNVYDTLMVGRANSQFYYTRYKCHMQLKHYQQALNDIAHAAVLDRQEPTYLAEMASLQFKVNLLEDAIQTADLCISVAPSYPDAYLIKGLALIQNKQKKEGLDALNKAKALGDTRAQGFIDKYK